MAERNLARLVARASSAGCPADAGPSDVDLLARFVADGDAAAFEAIVRRHGPVVWGICRGILRQEADAEDAFQAVFLALARRASAVRRPEALAGWLYGAAIRVARKARALAARERGPVPAPPRPPDPALQAAWGEVQAAVLEEVGRLPEKFRLPFVLCVLQGLGKAAAAARLGWPEGTVSGRLAEARARLRRALTRRGVVPAAGLAVLDLALGTARAVPRRLASAALAAASPGGTPDPRILSLVAGASKPMTTTVLKSIALLVAAAVAAASAAPLLPGGAAPPAPSAPRGEGLPADPPAPARLPDGAVARLGTTAFRPGHGVRAVAFTPGGSTAASACDDGAVRLWDLASGRELRRYEGLEDAARTVAYADGGKLVVAVGGRDAILTWEADSGKVAASVTVDQEYALRGGPLAVSPDGRLVAGVGADAGFSLGVSRTVQVWDARTGKEVAALGGHAGQLWALAFSPDGKTLATGGEDRVVRVFEVGTAKELTRFGGKWTRALALAFSPDGKVLAVSADDGVTRVWEVATKREVRAVKGFGQSVAFSPDGTKLAADLASAEPVDGGKRVTVWDLATGREVCRTGELDSSNNAVTFSPDGKTLATWTHYPTTNTFRLWDAGTGAEVGPHAGHRGSVTALAFSPDGKTLVSGGADGRRLNWSTDDWAAVPARPAGGREVGGGEVVSSPDGKVLATGGGWSVTLTDAGGGKPRQLEEIPRTEAGSSLKALAFSPDGGILVTVRLDGVVRSWATATGKSLGAFETTGKGDKRTGTGFVAAAVSPDTKSVAVVEWRGAVRLYDRATGAEVRRLEEHDGPVSAVAFAPDGKTLAYFAGDVWLVDPATGAARRRIPVEGGVVRLALSPDGSVLAAACVDGKVRTYRPDTGAELGQLTGHKGPVYALAFSADGKTLASGGADTIVLVWKVPAAKAPAPNAPAPKGAAIEKPGQRTTDGARPTGAYAEILERFEAAEVKWAEEWRAARSDAEKTKAVRGRADPVPSAREFLELARTAGPTDPAAADALLWVITYYGSADGFEPLRAKAAEALEADRLAGVGKMTLLRAFGKLEYPAHPAGSRILRAVADKDPRPEVRARALLSLARQLLARAGVVRRLAASAKDSELATATEAWFGRDITRLLREEDADRLEKDAAAAYRVLIERYADLPYPPKKMGDVARAGLEALESLAVGRPAPALEGTALDGKALKLSDYKGKVVVLVFSGPSWCGPCRAEMKDHLALAKAYAGRPLAVVGVYAEPDADWLRRYLEKEKVPWRGIREDKGGPLAVRWNVEAWPAVYVIDAGGVIRFKGLRGKDLTAALETLVRQAEGER